MCASRRLVSLVTLVASPVVASSQALQGSAQHADALAPNFGLKEMGIGAGIVALAYLADRPVHRAFDGAYGSGTARIAKDFDGVGSTAGVVTVVGGLGVAALITRNSRITHTFAQTVASLAIASGVSQVIKYTVGRSRPYADPDADALDFRPLRGVLVGSPSFPSGHTTVAFSLATSLGEGIGNRWVQIGLWGIAAGTGWARLREGQHWFTDVVAGAGLGIISAKFASGHLRVLGVRAPHFLISPHRLGVIVPLTVSR